GAGAHSFTAKQTDAATNVSISSNPAQTMSAVQTGALIGADGVDNNNVSLTVSQYSADGITSIDTAAKASLLNDIIDTLSASAVDSQSELEALAATVAGIFVTAAGGDASPALTPEALAAVGISGVNADNLAAVIAALAATADNGSGVDSLSELLSVVDASVAASNAALAVISAYTGSNTAPTSATYEDAGVSGVSASNISAINSAIAQLGQTATDTASEVQAVVDAYATLLNAADGVANGGATLSISQFQTLGITVIDTNAEALLLNAVIDVGSSASIDTYAELTNLASIVNRFSIIAAGGTASPALTAQDFEALGITGVTAENLSAVIAAIAGTADDGSGINAMAILQNVVDEGIANARAASQAVIATYTGTNTAPTLADYQNAAISGVTSSNIAAINSLIGELSEAATDSQVEVQAVVDAYALVVAAANGLADGGATLGANDYASLGLDVINTTAEVSLMNDLLDAKSASGVDTYAELAAIASAVSGVIAEANGVNASPTLTVADFALLGITGVTESNLSQVIAALRASSGVDTLSELRSTVASAVAAAKAAAINVISQYDGTSGSAVPTLADYANAEVSGVTNVNLMSINSAFAQINEISSDSTSEIQATVSAYVSVLAGADGIDNNNMSISSSSYSALGLSAIDTTGKASLLNDVLDVKLGSGVDTYEEIGTFGTIISSIFVLSTGEQPETELTVAMFTSLGITGVSNENLQLVVDAIIATNDDTTGVDSLIKIQSIVTLVRSNQANALAAISGYTGSNTTPTLSTFTAAGVVGVDAQNISVINQFLASMSSAQTDTVAEVQALIDAVNKLLLCADGIANNNCNLTMEEFHALGYVEIDTAEMVAELNDAMDSLDLTPSQEVATVSPVVDEIVRRFTSIPVNAGPQIVPVIEPVIVPTTSTIVTTPSTSLPVVTIPRTPVVTLPASKPIEVAPGESAATVGGESNAPELTITADNTARIELGGVVIEIAPQDAARISDGLGTAVRAVRGRYVEVRGNGFAPVSQVEVWIYSDPTLLGSATTDTNGEFVNTFDIPKEIELGNHTLTLNGVDSQGVALTASVGIIVIEDPQIEELANDQDKRGEPFNPLDEPKGVLDLVANMVALMALMALSGSAGSGSSSGSGRKEDEDEDRGSGDVSDVSVKSIGADGEGADRLRLPRFSLADRIMTRTPEAAAHRSPMIGRVLQDGTYLRSLFGALWLLLPVAGVVLGIASAFNTNFEVVMPSLALLSAIVVIGTLDAFAGFLGAIVFAVAVLAGGGINSADSIRGLLGIWVMSFAVPMLASASRPFRRKNAIGLAGAWDRSTDFILILLFGALAAGSMFSSLPGLTGFRPEFAGNVAGIQIVAMCVLAVRFILENATVKLTPTRYRELTDLALRDASNVQQIISSLIRTAVFLFVAEVFIGNNWALWVGGVLYLVPKLVGLVVDKFPNVESLHRWMPRGILKVTVMMLVARIWGLVLTDAVSDPAQMIMFSFVFMGTPGLVTTVLGWFGRSSSRPWPQTWFTRIAGLIILIIGILMVRGVLFAF
ncbi:MAG: hypothetical protein RL073_1378, partial [Actinomycetota bacterium]